MESELRDLKDLENAPELLLNFCDFTVFACELLDSRGSKTIENRELGKSERLHRPRNIPYAVVNSLIPTLIKEIRCGNRKKPQSASQDGPFRCRLLRVPS